jgi:glycosyltransferase involved in cell wall biosynthesis
METMASRYAFVEGMIETAKNSGRKALEEKELKKGVKGVFGRLTYSVVVPAYNDRSNLINCLKSLSALHYPLDKFEVIVVDDGSSDRSFEAVQRFKSEQPQLDLTLLRQENKGPCGARNAGLEKAKNEFIAFIDSDEMAEANWLKHAQKYFEDEKVAAVEGSIIVPQKEKITPFTHQTPIDHGGEFVTGNIIYRKKVIDEVGRFDERFYDRKRKVHFREDADLAFKVLEKGREIVYAPEVITFHPPQKGQWTKPLRLAKRHYFDALIFKKHPQKARQFISNYQIKRPRQRSYLAYLLSLAGLAGGLASQNQLAVNAFLALFAFSYLFVYWLHIRYVKFRLSLLTDYLLLLPIAFLVPLYFFEAFIRGTIRFKELVV